MGEQLLPAVVYAAKSTDDAKGSIERQVADCHSAIEREGGREVVVTFTDEAASAYKGNRGAGLADAKEAVLTAAEEHGVAELWVQHSDRVARGDGITADHLAEVWFALRRAGVRMRSVQDDGNLEDAIRVVLMGERNFEDSARKSQAVRSGKNGQMERGERLGGPQPDGLRIVREVDGRGKFQTRYERDPERAVIIERAFELSEGGHGDGHIARVLNAEGHRTQKRTVKSERSARSGEAYGGKPFSRSRVQNMLTNQTYAGRVVRYRGKPNEKVVQSSNVEPLIEAERFDRINAARAARDLASPERHRRGGRSSTRHALAKLAVCHRCGERMYAQVLPHVRKDGTQRRRYVCKSVHTGTGMCDAPSVDAERVDTAVAAHLERLFIDVESWQAELSRGASAKRDRAAEKLARAEAELAKLNRREPKLRDRYIAAITEETNDPAVVAAYEAMIKDRDAVRERIPGLLASLDAIPTETPVDAVLDLYNELARALRGGQGETLAALNVRLRTVFAEFRLETLPDDGVIGVLPVLHADVVERYGSDEIAVIIGGEQVGVETTAATHPVALFATGEESVPVDGRIDLAEHFALWRQEEGSRERVDTLRRSGG